MRMNLSAAVQFRVRGTPVEVTVRSKSLAPTDQATGLCELHALSIDLCNNRILIKFITSA